MLAYINSKPEQTSYAYKKIIAKPYKRNRFFLSQDTNALKVKSMCPVCARFAVYLSSSDSTLHTQTQKNTRPIYKRREKQRNLGLSKLPSHHTPLYLKSRSRIPLCEPWSSLASSRNQRVRLLGQETKKTAFCCTNQKERLTLSEPNLREDRYPHTRALQVANQETTNIDHHLSALRIYDLWIHNACAIFFSSLSMLLCLQ